jgi:hypothetical protein
VKPYWRKGEYSETFMVEDLPRAGVARAEDGRWVAYLTVDEGLESNTFDNPQDARNWCEITLKLLCGY